MFKAPVSKRVRAIVQELDTNSPFKKRQVPLLILQAMYETKLRSLPVAEPDTHNVRMQAWIVGDLLRKHGSSPSAEEACPSAIHAAIRSWGDSFSGVSAELQLQPYTMHDILRLILDTHVLSKLNYADLLASLSESKLKADAGVSVLMLLRNAFVPPLAEVLCWNIN